MYGIAIIFSGCDTRSPPPMGTGGEISAFAAVHGEIWASESPPASSARSSEDSLNHDDNTFLPLSSDTSKLPAASKSVIKLGVDNVGVRLGKGENAFVVGLFSLWIKYGEVALLGASLRASSTLHQVFAPVTHAVPSITGVSEWAELVISTNDSGIRYLGDTSPHFAGIWEPTSVSTPLSFHVLGYHFRSGQDGTKELRRLALEQWLPPIRQILQQRSNVPKILISGSKGAGKSTLSRILVNTMLTMNTSGSTSMAKAFPDGVMLLDLDPGQPELAVPGIIYLAHVHAPLFGPSFTNLIVPGAVENTMLRMHYLGANTPRDSPSHYQRCASDLLSLYRNHEDVPLIINTCGWNSGSGKTALLSAIRDVTLTNVIDIGGTRNAAVHDLMQSDVGGTQKIPTQILAQTKRTPLKSGRDLREMQLQAYLHAQGFAHGRILWDQLPIATSYQTLPATSDISSVLFMIVVFGDDVVPEYILDVLDGSVAAIVLIKHYSPLHRLSAGVASRQDDLCGKVRIALTPNGHLPYLAHGDKIANALDPETTECIGLGLITAVRFEKRQLHVRSPVPAAHIEAAMAKGYRIALAVARQQGLWSTSESMPV